MVDAPPTDSLARARPRESVTEPTDDDIRRKLRIAAYNGASTLAIAVAPLPETADPRDPGWAPYFNAREMNRMQSAAEKAVAAWVRTVAPETEQPPGQLGGAADPAKRAALLEMLRAAPPEIAALLTDAARSPSPAFVAALTAAGWQQPISASATAGALSSGPKGTIGS